MVFYVFVALLSAFMCIAVVLLWRYERRRRRRLAEEAERLGLRYSYFDPFGIHMTYAHVHHLNLGIQQHAFNLVHGTYKGHSVMAFDFSYSVEPKKRRRNQPLESYILSLLILMTESVRFPELVVRYRPLAEKFPPLPPQFHDVTFDSLGFSHMYQVASTDPEFARAVLHNGMRDYLARHPGTTIEINGNTMLAHLGEITTAETLEPQLNRLIEIRSLIPAHLFETGAAQVERVPSDS